MKKLNYSFLSLFFLLFVQLAAVAQLPQYHVRMLSSEQGLNTADIISMAKDSNGFLWLLSQSMVQRYDGKQAIPFAFNETLEEIFIDNKDRKWVVGRKGIYIFKDDYHGFTDMTPEPAKNKSAVCLFHSGSTLYLLSTDGLRRFDERKGKFVSSETDDFVNVKKIPSVYCKTNHMLFVASTDSIFQIDLLTRKKQAIAFKSMSFMMAIADDELLVSDWDSKSYLLSFYNKEKKLLRPKDIHPGNTNEFIRFFSGVQMAGSRHLISTNIGIVEYNQEQRQFNLPVIFYKGRTLHNSTSAKPFYRDKDGNVYMSHADGIVFFNPNNEPIHYIRDYSDGNNSIPDIDVRSFTEDQTGQIWIATVNGICRLNMRTGAIKNYLATASGNGINFPSIRYLLYNDGYVWTGTGGKGIWLLNTTTDKFIRPVFSNDSAGKLTAQMLNEDFIWKLEPLIDGNIFVVGGSGKYLVNAKTFEARSITLAHASGGARSALQDASGRIWYGSSNGLYCYDSHFNFLFSIRDSLIDKRVASICEWKKDHLLIGSKGLYEVTVKNNSITAFKKHETVPSSKLLYCMQQDGNGNVWLGTNEGLYRFNPQTGTAELFDAADNVQPQAFNSNGLFQSTNNLIFAGGKTGFNYFYPGAVKQQQQVLAPLVTSLSIGNNDSVFFKQAAPFDVPYFNRNVVVSISAPEYMRPYKLQYRYRLNNSNWILNGTNSIVRLHNMEPGHYSFLASVSYDGQKWFDAAVPVPLIVCKPWWQQWWFRLVSLCAALLVFIAYYQYKKRQRENKEYQKTIDYFANSGYEHSGTDDILWDITRNCISRMGFEDCVIYLLDEERQLLVQRAAYGAKSSRKFEILNPIEIPLGKGITGFVAKTGIAEIVNDTAKDNRYVVDDEVRLSELVVPIIHNEKVVGVIDSENKRKNFFNAKHLETLQTIASICAGKISLSIAVEKMQKAVKQVEEVNNKMLETKFMNLRLQMNPHFLFNSLSSIQHLIVSGQTNEAYQYLTVFSGFLRSVLQYADKTVITLDDELKMLSMYIKLESLGFDKTFTYDIQVDESLETDDIFIPPLIIQPLIENAIWHGLMHKEGDKHFSVQFVNNNDDDLRCIVEDNGIGRQKAAAIDANSLSHFAYQSKATALIKERLQLLKQKTGKEATMFTEDKMENGQPTGTRITIIIPYYNNNNDEP